MSQHCRASGDSCSLCTEQVARRLLATCPQAGILTSTGKSLGAAFGQVSKMRCLVRRMHCEKRTFRVCLVSQEVTHCVRCSTRRRPTNVAKLAATSSGTSQDISLSSRRVSHDDAARMISSCSGRLQGRGLCWVTS
jgi:hypothetical protein